jgi:hypothetical protein
MPKSTPFFHGFNRHLFGRKPLTEIESLRPELGCYGSPIAQSPVLDQLDAEYPFPAEEWPVYAVNDG